MPGSPVVPIFGNQGPPNVGSPKSWRQMTMMGMLPVRSWDQNVEPENVNMVGPDNWSQGPVFDDILAKLYRPSDIKSLEHFRLIQELARRAGSGSVRGGKLPF